MWGLSLGWNAHLLNLDFDPTVVGIASQPFWLHWIDAAGKPDSHAPDFFARRSDGSAVVVDSRPVERRRPRDVAKFEATARACALAGWEYRLLGEADALVTANLRWFAGWSNRWKEALNAFEITLVGRLTAGRK